MAINWDKASAIRERLALLAKVGPEELKEYGDAWCYDPRRDVWHRPDRNAQVIIQTEGSASLEVIAERWGLSRVEAMAFIGYPEATR